MEDTLHQRIIGQDEAVKAISPAIRRARVVYDINGREVEEVEPILDALPKLEQYIYFSSAGVYLKSDMLPHVEVDAVDPKSRHKGKLETENLLQSRDVKWTSIRPVYIYGPLNYNPVEECRNSAKTPATYYFGFEEAMIRFDMSEFMERHLVSKLIGSPPVMSATPRGGGHH
ncbi:hypothetical protein IFM89_028904 [Coptis chinensis]|uniref:ATPase AAA-type core domain-containing protein n=1 Tax=Coptis chinensis TaxID=261450 RepID=A0A835LJ13_9MAGN|nr:hypothetical protein IFM89_028904 [Coptis chinensis]